MEYAADFGLTVNDHCEDPHWAGVMNEAARFPTVGRGRPPCPRPSRWPEISLLPPIWICLSIWRTSVVGSRWNSSLGQGAQHCCHCRDLPHSSALGMKPLVEGRHPRAGQPALRAKDDVLPCGRPHGALTKHGPCPHADRRGRDLRRCAERASGLIRPLFSDFQGWRGGELDSATLPCCGAGKRRRFSVCPGTGCAGRPGDFILFDPERSWMVATGIHAFQRERAVSEPGNSGRVMDHYLGGTVFSSEAAHEKRTKTRCA